MSLRKSLPKICIALGFPDVKTLLAHAEREVEAGERFLEFRLDYLPQPEAGVEAIRQFLQRHPECTLMATCRRHQNHGRFNGSIEEQIRILEMAVQAGAAVVDVEIETAESIAAKLDALRNQAGLLISYHNFSGTPPLDPVLRRMTRIAADGYKIVTTAKKPSDCARVLALAREHPKTPLVLLAMTECGFPTRVLSPAFGGMYTYAAPHAAEGTAAGQVSARQLRQLYRIDRFSSAARIFGVVADPVRHSISPAVHNRAFQAKRYDAVYLPLLVRGAQLKDLLALAESLPLSGFSVTIPHKQRILRYLDAIDPLSKRIGAVNTVWRKAGRWRGTNTDAAGIRVPLEKRTRLGHKSVLVLGNGGAARSAAFTLSAAGANVTITGRNLDRVRALAKACGGECLTPEAAAQAQFDILVHATPVGMWPHGGESFFTGRIPGEIVFDLVYTPQRTRLIQLAEEQGKTVICGIEMFVEQALAQFELFTGAAGPRAVMEKAAREAIAEQEHRSVV